jgi:hypothetical protein
VQPVDIVASLQAIDVIAVITWVAGVVTAIGGVFLAVRAVRSKERKSAKADLDTVNTMLAQERHLRLQSERYSYDLALELAKHGIKVPPPDTVEVAIPPPDTGGEKDG